MARSRTPARSGLRLAELKARQPDARRTLLNVKMPAHLVEAIDQLAEHLGASKTETMVMLLNEGLARVKRGKRS